MAATAQILRAGAGGSSISSRGRDGGGGGGVSRGREDLGGGGAGGGYRFTHEQRNRKQASPQGRRAAEAREEQREEAAERLRQVIAGHLNRKGWVRDGGDGGSMYFRRGKQVVRVSDHDVPMTAERAYNIGNGGFSWSDTSRSLVIRPGTKPMEALRWVVAVSRA